MLRPNSRRLSVRDVLNWGIRRASRHILPPRILSEFPATMKGLASVLGFVLLTMICWGIYGPVLTKGQVDMHSGLRPFICVGLAYFVIAVAVPVALLKTTGEKGHWTATGLFWSLLAGVVTAIGALGIILAIGARGSPLYVMPLVFGIAPVVNSFV